jgi:AmmeMemoRadiSam system protein A
MRFFLDHQKMMPLPEGDLPAELTKPAGVFVSLKKQGRLRGCIGTFMPTKPSAAQEVIRNAVSAATEDPRFPPVTRQELEQLEVSVDILAAPEPVNSLNELDCKRYGVIVRRGNRSGLLLPDLEGVDSVEEQVEIAMQKAGIASSEPIELFRFEVIRYY